MLDLNFIPHPLIGTPYGTALDLCIILSIAAYLLSVVTREYSWVDRLWTLCPPIYCLIVAASLDFESVRVNLMTVLVCVWGARLTYNYARKGGFAKGGEDYRWAEIQKRMGPIGFQVLNLVFIAPGQMLIVWLFTAPVHIAWINQEMALNWIDALAGLVFFAFLAGEAVSDEQMWRFQQEKKRNIAAGEPVDQGFMTTGLFVYCRHPSYICEFGMWWSFYWFAIAASGQLVNWTWPGFIVLTMIFFGSSRLAESISLSKYPSYADYQASTPRIIPFTGIGKIKQPG